MLNTSIKLRRCLRCIKGGVGQLSCMHWIKSLRSINLDSLFRVQFPPGFCVILWHFASTASCSARKRSPVYDMGEHWANAQVPAQNLPSAECQLSSSDVSTSYPYLTLRSDMPQHSQKELLGLAHCCPHGLAMGADDLPFTDCIVAVSPVANVIAVTAPVHFVTSTFAGDSTEVNSPF